jgi:Lar family restriction alleviation protein
MNINPIEFIDCPFCGSHEDHRPDSQKISIPEVCEYWTVVCTNCGVMCGAYPNEIEAIEAWNTRLDKDG